MKTVFWAFFFVAGMALTVSSLEQSPHRYKEAECALCHRGEPGAKTVDEALTARACLRCHRDFIRKGFMHPVDVRPVKAMVPRDLPLSSNGMVSCTTCHRVHAPHQTEYGARTYFLRRKEQGRTFCASCHRQATLNGDSGHQALLGEAHFQSMFIASDRGGSIDETSRNCISCHDGTYATSVRVSAGVWRHSSNYTGAANGLGAKHPIGIDYEGARLRHGRKTDLRPLASVDKRIQFFDGKVGCGSCHNPFSPLENDLVMENRHSALCFACHMIDQ